jgi:DNA-binding transcriptional regulator YiaG
MDDLVAEVRAARRLPSPATARAIRLSAGVTVTRMAAELGVHRVTLHRWEAGTRTPHGRQRAEYADLLRRLYDDDPA